MTLNNRTISQSITRSPNHPITRFSLGVAAVIVGAAVSLYSAAAPIRVMLLDGANNHDWKTTSPVIA
jgi:hypothetical protein